MMNFFVRDRRSVYDGIDSEALERSAFPTPELPSHPLLPLLLVCLQMTLAVADPGPSQPPEIEVEDSLTCSAIDAEKIDAIFTCKFPGCTRQYASTDGEPTV